MIYALLFGQMIVCRGEEVERGEPALCAHEVLETSLGRDVGPALELRHLDLPLAIRGGGAVELEGDGGGVGGHAAQVKVHCQKQKSKIKLLWGCKSV